MPSASEKNREAEGIFRCIQWVWKIVIFGSVKNFLHLWALEMLKTRKNIRVHEKWKKVNICDLLKRIHWMKIILHNKEQNNTFIYLSGVHLKLWKSEALEKFSLQGGLAWSKGKKVIQLWNRPSTEKISLYLTYYHYVLVPLRCAAWKSAGNIPPTTQPKKRGYRGNNLLFFYQNSYWRIYLQAVE